MAFIHAQGWHALSPAPVFLHQVVRSPTGKLAVHAHTQDELYWLGPKPDLSQPVAQSPRNEAAALAKLVAHAGVLRDEEYS